MSTHTLQLKPSLLPCVICKNIKGGIKINKYCNSKFIFSVRHSSLTQEGSIYHAEVK